jgi:hypothetical protein
VKTCKARDIEAALLKKGFRVNESHHKLFYLTKDGKITGVHTFLSHGLKEYPTDLLAKMRAQLHLSGKEFDDLIHCPLSFEDYLALLRERGVVE